MRKLKMLIVDDDPLIVRLVEAILQNSDYADVLDYVSYTDPVLATEWIDNNSCDLVLTDFEMPKIDGIDILKTVRQKNAWTQVVFLTAHSTIDRLTNAMQQGASDYLMKPLDRSELLEVVGNLVQRMKRWNKSARSTLADSRFSATRKLLAQRSRDNIAESNEENPMAAD